MSRFPWKRLSVFLSLSVVSTFVAFIGCQTMGRSVTTADLIDYRDAAPGFGFPRASQQLLDYRDAHDVAAMRRHGWEIWAALTQPGPGGFSIFLSWYQVKEVFGAEASRDRRLFAPEFRVPPQKTLGDGDAILSFNVYNAPLRDHVRQHGYQRRAALAALVGRESDVQPFPGTSMAVKTVWWPVRANGLTAFPVWDQEPKRPVEWGRGVQDLVKAGLVPHLDPAQQAELASHDRHGNDFETFARVVAIDASRMEIPKEETAAGLFFDPEDLTLQANAQRTARVVSLQQFFHVQINDRYTVDLINNLPLTDQITTRFWKRPFRIGDYVALVAAHVTTRETPDWVWATFWWHDQPDAPPFGADRPKPIHDVWRQYPMRVAYHGDIPREPDGSPHIAFNPYVEASFSFGLQSNCVVCHQRAVIGPDGPGAVLPVRRGHLSRQDPLYAGKVRLDFLWSLAFEAR